MHAVKIMLARRWLVVLVLTLSVSWSRADSTLNFPRLTFDPGTLVGIAIVNTTNQDAEVDVTAYTAGGQLQTGLLRNPAQLVVPANQQVSILAKDFNLFGPGPQADTVGWFQATSTNDGLVGFFLFVGGIVGGKVTQFGGAVLPTSSRNLIFTRLRIDSGYTSELNVINPGSSEANLTLTLISPPAAPVSKNLVVPANGASRQLAASFFGVAELSPNAYVQLSSDVPVAGFELVRSPDGDLVGLNARPADEELTHLYFPQMVVLGGVETTLGVVNNSDEAIILTITAFKTDGSPYDQSDLQENPVNRALNPGAALTEDLESMFGFTGNNTLGGWLQVKSTSPAVTGYLNYGEPAKGYSATITPTRTGQDRAIFSHIQTNLGFFTGVAVINPGQLAVDLTLLSITRGGQIQGSFTTVLAPGAQYVALIGTEQLIPEATGQDGGLIFLTSNLPVYAASLFGDFQQTVLASIPPQDSPEGYAPDAGLQLIEIAPALSILQPSQSQTFQVQGSAAQPLWKVNNVEGGEASIGTITPQGVYTAPPEVPLPRVVTVSADVGSQSGGASVDVLEKEQLLSSQLIVQSVAYLGSLERLYSAELALLGAVGQTKGAASTAPAQGSDRSEIFQADGPGLPKSQLAVFEGDSIVKMVPYTASTGDEFLLLVGETSGTLIRLDPRTSGSTVVASGFNAPNAAVVDQNSGNVLVADADQVRLVPRPDVEAGLVSSSSSAAGPAQGLEAASLPFIDLVGGAGVAIDQCTGDVYLTNRDQGTLVRFSAREQRIVPVFDGLRGPAQLLGIYRRSVSCPDAFQLLVVETEADRLSLATPARGLVNSWLNARSTTDVTFIPGNTPFAGTSAILVTELVESQSQQLGGNFTIQSIGVPGLVDPIPENGILRDQAQITDLAGNLKLLYPPDGETFQIAQGESVLPLAIVGSLSGSFAYQGSDGQVVTIRAGVDIPASFDEDCEIFPETRAEIIFEIDLDTSRYEGVVTVPNAQARSGTLPHPCLGTPISFEITPQLANLLNAIPLPNGRVRDDGSGEYRFFGDLPGGNTGNFNIPPFTVPEPPPPMGSGAGLAGQSLPSQFGEDALPVGRFSVFPPGQYTVQIEARIQQQLVGRDSVSFTVVESGGAPPPSPSGQGAGGGEQSAIPYQHLLLLFVAAAVVAARLRR